MNTYITAYQSFLSDFGKGRKMVLSTSVNDKVSSRMMSVVLIDGLFYFQTDVMLRKYRQLSYNSNVALCIDNLQIEGVCKEIGKPLSNADFCNRFQECFKGSYDAYSSLENERLFVINPTYIERWIYIDSVPYIEIFDIKANSHEIKRYIGV